MKTLKTATVKAFEVNLSPGNLDGLKTIIGIVLIIASQSLEGLAEIIQILPDVPVLVTVQDVLVQVIEIAEKLLEVLGSGFLGFGLVDKIWKFIKALGT